jgi:energy-coupling factor transporter ATP-binding protein EcfA2
MFPIIIVAIIFINSKTKADKKLKLQLLSSFGKPPDEEEYDLESIKKYSHNKKAHIIDELRVDDITWNDLNMDKVYKRINVCLTSIGEEYLYNCLHELQVEPGRLLKREEIIEFFTVNSEERLAAQFCLAKMGKVKYNRLASLIFNPDIKLFNYPFIYNFLSILPLFCALTLLYSIPTGIICILLSFLINLVVYIKSKRKVDIEIPAISYFASALYCCKKLCKINAICSLPLMTEIKRKYLIFKSLEGRLPLPRTISGNFMEDIYEYFNILFLIDIRNYNKYTKMILKYNNDFHSLYKAIGEIDLVLCVLSFRNSLPIFSVPEFHTQNTIEFEELFHPLITSPVRNTGALINDSLITGSNASGKSTFIKSLAVNGILAQTIYTSTAKKFRTRFSMIVTSMAMRDDILAGESYFTVEVKSLKRILDAVQKHPCTCYIDEILRGTNTIERIASSVAVLEHLHLQDCLCVVASHDIELTNLLADKYDNYHFCEQITDDEITFDYKLKQGVSGTRNAIKLLKLMGFKSEIVKRAEELSFEQKD